MCPKRNGGEGRAALRGTGCEDGGKCIAQSAGVHRRCVGGRKCSGRACRCAGTGEDLWRGTGCEDGGECIAQPAGVHRRCVGGGSARGGRVAVRGRAKTFGGERVVRTAGNASHSLRACVGAAWGSGSARERRVAVRGRAKVFGGERVVRSAGLTHIRRSSSRARVLLYIRPPCPRREIAVLGAKDAPCEHPSPAKTFAPAPSAFVLPRPRSHFPRVAFGLPPNDFRTRPVRVCTSVPAFTLPPRSLPLPPHSLRRPPRSNRHSAAAVIHNGLSTEKLSTSLLAALCKTFSSSRLRTRIYNMSFARRPLPGVSAPLWGRGCAVVAPCPAPPSAGWGRAKAKSDAPSRSNPHFRRLRPSPCPLVCRITVRKGGVHKVIPAPARAFSPRQLVYGRAPAR